MRLTKTAWVLHICTWRHLPLWNHDHLCHWSRLDLQTQEKAVETANLQLGQQNIQFTSSPTRMSSLLPQLHPTSTDLATGPIPTQRSGFPKGMLLLSTRESFQCHHCVMGNCLQDAATLNLKKNPTLDWALRVTDPGQFCRHQLVLHFERRVIPFLIIKNTFL